MKHVKLILNLSILGCILNAHADVTATQAWSRATATGQTMGGAFVTLTNTSKTDATLVSAYSPAAQKTELHTMVMDHGVMKMQTTSSVVLPAGQATTLQPGGMHIMLMGLKSPLKAGQTLPLTLTVRDGGKTKTIKLNAAIQPLSGDNQTHHGH